MILTPKQNAPNKENRLVWLNLQPCLNVTERFIGPVAVHRRWRGVRGVMGVRAVGSLSALGTKGFVGVRGLLGSDTALVSVVMVVRGTAGTAAGADEPEQGGTEGEGNGKPGGDEDVLSHASLDVVFFEFLVEKRCKDGEESR